MLQVSLAMLQAPARSLAAMADGHGTARHGTARHNTTRHGTARHGPARHGTERHGTARHGTHLKKVRKPSTETGRSPCMRVTRRSSMRSSVCSSGEAASTQRRRRGCRRACSARTAGPAATTLTRYIAIGMPDLVLPPPTLLRAESPLMMSARLGSFACVSRNVALPCQRCCPTVAKSTPLEARKARKQRSTTDHRSTTLPGTQGIRLGLLNLDVKH
jgi:hypothetical protein